MKIYIFLVIGILFLPQMISLPIYNDGGAYAYMGTLFFEGKIPYIDGWDHKGITLYLINGLGYLIGFKNYIGIRILELALICFSFLNIYKILEIKYSKLIAFIAFLFGLFSFRYFFDGGNLTEEYGSLFVLIALSLLLKDKEKRVDYIIIGVLFIVNITIRANLISFWVALFFSMLIFYVLKRKNIYKLIGHFVNIGLGFIIGISILVIYFLITDSFFEFYNAAFTYNLTYSKQSIADTILIIIKSIRLYEVSIVMLLALLISIISLFKKRVYFIEVLLLFWVPIELYFCNVSGRMFAHYYMMWVPIIVLSTAHIIHYFKIEFMNREKQFALLGITMFLFFQIPVFSTLLDYKSLFFHQESVLVRERLVDHLRKDYKEESILIWGNAISFYSLIEKRATVPYFYQTFLKVNSKTTEKMIKDLTTKFIENSPELLVDARTPSLLFIDGSNEDIIDSHQKENFGPLFQFIETNYILKEKKYGKDFYVKKE